MRETFATGPIHINHGGAHWRRRREAQNVGMKATTSAAPSRIGAECTDDVLETVQACSREFVAAGGAACAWVLSEATEKMEKTLSTA
ncbi:hypothetical protein MRX96_042291 [Rhipicephalus microplus]